MTTSKTVIVPVEVLTQAREALRDWEIREKRYAAIERIDALLAAPAPDAALSDAGKGDELGNILAAIRDHAHAQLDVVGANLAQQALSAYAAPLEREDATERERFEQLPWIKPFCKRDERGYYVLPTTNYAWQGWQARASISTTPSYTTPNGYSFSRNHDGDELLLKDGKVVVILREMVGKGKAAGCDRDATLAGIRALAEQGMCHGLLADDYCRQIISMIDALQSKVEQQADTKEKVEPVADDIGNLIAVAQYLQTVKHWEAQAHSKVIAQIAKRMLAHPPAQARELTEEEITPDFLADCVPPTSVFSAVDNYVRMTYQELQQFARALLQGSKGEGK